MTILGSYKKGCAEGLLLSFKITFIYLSCGHGKAEEVRFRSLLRIESRSLDWAACAFIHEVASAHPLWAFDGMG